MVMARRSLSAIRASIESSECWVFDSWSMYPVHPAGGKPRISLSAIQSHPHSRSRISFVPFVNYFKNRTAGYYGPVVFLKIPATPDSHSTRERAMPNPNCCRAHCSADTKRLVIDNKHKTSNLWRGLGGCYCYTRRHIHIRYIYTEYSIWRPSPDPETKAFIDSRPMSDTPMKYYRPKAFGLKAPQKMPFVSSPSALGTPILSELLVLQSVFVERDLIKIYEYATWFRSLFVRLGTAGNPWTETGITRVI